MLSTQFFVDVSHVDSKNPCWYPIIRSRSGPAYIRTCVMSSLVLPMKSVLNFLSLLTEVVIPAHLAVD